MSQLAPVVTLEPTSARSPIGTGFMFLAGVLLPAVTVAIEAGSGFCAQHFFDPIPTWLHVLLVSLVPLANAVALLGTDWANRWPRAMGLVNGVAIVVSLYFAIAFAPLMPIALIAIVFLGMGLLPLSPLLSLMVALRARKHLRHAAGEGRLRGLWTGLAIGLAALAVADGRIWATHYGLHLADSPDTRAAGVGMLRSVGIEREMLRACYSPAAPSKYAVGFLLPTAPSLASARATYYRVTGDSFNDADRPIDHDRRTRLWDGDDIDGSLGGTAVAGRVADLYLDESRLDGVIDGDAAWTYVEWTMVFRNDAPFDPKEARLQMALPAGGVTSRVTLWVNGVPCEAAFGGSAETRRAYTQVAVVERRDPLLVTTAGPDRILVQCFPILPKSTMKIRVGITAPLALDGPAAGTVALPAIVERNFGLSAGLRHSVLLDAPTALAADRLQPATRSDGRHELVGQIDDGQLGLREPVRVARNPAVTAVVTRETVKGRFETVVQRLIEQPAPVPSRVVAVVDLSRHMAPCLPDVAAALATLTDRTKLTVIAAGDTLHVLDDPAQLANLSCQGGIDASAALGHALDLLANERDAAVLWIHGRQPELLDSAQPLLQRLERRGREVPILAVQVLPGPHRLIEQMDGHVRPIHALDRARFTQTIDGLWRGTLLSPAREAVPLPPGDMQPASSHVARLWAADRVRELADHQQRKEAVELASGYQLVTPVSGAVVLETQAQYAANNLQPVDPSSTPTVPEPGSLAAIALAGMALLARRRRRHN